MRLIRDHPDALEAALAAEYGVDLLDLWRGQLTFRRLLVLWRHLPDDSAVHRIASDGVRWSSLHYLVDDLRRTTLAVAGDKEPPPHPLSPAAAAQRHREAAVAEKRAPVIADAQRRRDERIAAIARGELTETRRP